MRKILEDVGEMFEPEFRDQINLILGSFPEKPERLKQLADNCHAAYCKAVCSRKNNTNEALTCADVAEHLKNLFWSIWRASVSEESAKLHKALANVPSPDEDP